jgi:hypothetical protein
MLLILLAFVCGFSLDVVWTRCVNDIQAKRAISAANMSVLIYLCTLVSTVLIVERCVLACAAYALGGWVGTYVAVKRKT